VVARSVLVAVVVGVAVGLVVGRSRPHTHTVTTVRTVSAPAPASLSARLPLSVFGAITKLLAPDPVAGPDQILPTDGAVWVSDLPGQRVRVIICDAVNGSEVVTYAWTGRRRSLRVFPTAQEILDAESAGDNSLDPPGDLLPQLILACP
jgi:hypothetical protein